VVPSVKPADETNTTRHQLVAVVDRRMVRAAFRQIQVRCDPVEDLFASGQVVAVHAWLQLLRVEVFRPPAHTGVAAVAAVHRTEPVEDFEQGRVGQVTHHISSTRTATPGRRPYDFDARSSTTAESSAITSPVNASRTALASLSMSGRPGQRGADSLTFWALRPVPKCDLGRDR